jgi:phosphoglucomutase
MEHWAAFETKMRAEGLNDSAIAAFKANYGVLVSGASTMVSESMIAPVESLPHMDTLKVKPDPSLLKKTLMLKLNGGLGTGESYYTVRTRLLPTAHSEC